MLGWLRRMSKDYDKEGRERRIQDAIDSLFAQRDALRAERRGLYMEEISRMKRIESLEIPLHPSVPKHHKNIYRDGHVNGYNLALSDVKRELGKKPAPKKEEVEARSVERAVRAYLSHEGEDASVWGRCGAAMRAAISAYLNPCKLCGGSGDAFDIPWGASAPDTVECHHCNGTGIEGDVL